MDDSRIREYASQVDRIPFETRNQMDKLFSDNKSAEFYHGLLTGFAYSYSLLPEDNPESPALQSIVTYMTYLADKILSRKVH